MMIFLLFLTVSGYCYTVGNGSPQDALKRLKTGNQRYAHDALEHPNRSSERREASKAVQFPYATVVGCSDSRVSPEIIFDEGVGDLFIVRVAGNVVGPLELESVEYAVQVLKSVFVLVLGHENCGAVQTVLEGKTKGIPALTELIEPAVKEGKAKDLQEAIKANALRMKNVLLKSKIISKLVREKKLELQAAYYHLDTGVVEFL